MKKLRNIAGNVLFSLAYLAFGIMAMGLAVKDIVFHVNAVRDNEAVIGTVRGVTSRIVGSGRNRHRVYTIVFSYEYDGLACTGEFETEKDLPDRLTGLVQDGSLIAAAEKKKVIAGDITKIVVALVILAGGLAMLFQLVDAVWDKEDGGGQQELPPANPDEERGQAGLPQ